MPTPTRSTDLSPIADAAATMREAVAAINTLKSERDALLALVRRVPRELASHSPRGDTLIDDIRALLARIEGGAK